MKRLILSAALMSAGLVMMAPAFGQTPSAQKQPTQDSAGGAGVACNPNEKPADPTCGKFKWHTQNLMPSNVVGSDVAAKSK
jgi:hypothetical protein